MAAWTNLRGGALPSGLVTATSNETRLQRVLLLVAVVLACGEEVPEPGRDAGRDGPRDSAADSIADSRNDRTPDLARDTAADAPSDAPPDSEPELAPDAAPNLPPDMFLVDAAVDVPVDLPVDLPADATADATVDVLVDASGEAGVCVGSPQVIPPGTLNKGMFVGTSSEVALAGGCRVDDLSGSQAFGPFTLTAPRRLVMFQAHSLNPVSYGFAVSAGCSFATPPIAGGASRCVHTVVDLSPGDYTILACVVSDRFSYLLEEIPAAPVPNRSCAGAVNLTATPSLIHDEPRIVDGDSRYYAFTLSSPSSPGFTFSEMEGERVRLSIRSDCSDLGTELFTGQAELCLPSSSYTLGTTDLPAGSYTAIVSNIPRGTKYRLSFQSGFP